MLSAPSIALDDVVEKERRIFKFTRPRKTKTGIIFRFAIDPRQILEGSCEMHEEQAALRSFQKSRRLYGRKLSATFHMALPTVIVFEFRNQCNSLGLNAPIN